MEASTAADPDRSAGKVVLKASVAARINVAFHQNSIPVIGEIEIVNETEGALAGVEIAVRSTPPFLAPKAFRLDHIAAGGLQQLSPVQVDLDAAFLRKLTEAVDGEVIVEARVNGEPVADARFSCRLLAANEWTGITTAPELIAAFVRPNDPSVDAILRNAAEKLRANGRDDALDGYRGGKARAWEVAEAIWAALVDERIVYALPPRSFERDGQKVRGPSAILERKLATCLDLTLLYAACLEQAGLHALIGFSEGHAFCGLWLKPEEFPLGVVDEAQTLRKRIALQDIAFIETTLLTSQPPLRFRAAVEKARTFVEEDAERRFELIVDVARARRRQIRPLATGEDAASPAVAVSAASGQSVEMEAPPDFIDEEAPLAEPDEPLDRLERWKRKLLDLSLRNRLLNFKAAKTAVELVCPNAGLLEDKLFAGDKLKLLPRAQLMSGADRATPSFTSARPATTRSASTRSMRCSAATSTQTSPSKNSTTASPRSTARRAAPSRKAAPTPCIWRSASSPGARPARISLVARPSSSCPSGWSAGPSAQASGWCAMTTTRASTRPCCRCCVRTSSW